MKKNLFALLIMCAMTAPLAAQTPAPPVEKSANAAPVTDCGCEDKPLPEVLAVVNGVKITKQDLTPETRTRVEQLHKQVIEARERELDLQIDSMLLESEAKKRGVTASQIIKDEVIARVQAPSEAEAQAFYDKNKSSIQGEFKDQKNNVLEFLRYQRQQELAQKLAERLRSTAQIKVIGKPSAPSSNNADRARVLAIVNDKQITMGDIENSLRPLIFNVQEQVYALRKQDIELKVNDTLLSQEAQKKGVTTRALLDTEVSAKVPRVTDAQAQEFYNQNKDRISGEFAQLKTQIVQYMQENKEDEATVAYAAQLRRASTVQINLTAPESPSFAIATDDQPVKGTANALVTIVAFTDFECPSCARQHPILDRIVNEFGDRVRLVVRDFPLSQHANARKAAEAAEAAREQGKYWEYATVLFRNQSALGVDKLRQYATDLGLDRARFDASLDSGKFAEKVQRDMMDGRKLGINGTPTLYINGKRISDNSYESLKSAVEANLKAQASLKTGTGN
ncbi:MAG TPA: thioredoxin domain-containing protein [Pyrinomonadaceae bacterium]|nr:thioredoxin domain-containing protein [Pyrinomonadaceae bacterium]